MPTSRHHEFRSPTYRLGVDIGGTFTDIVLVAEETGALVVLKTPTTPDDPSRGFLTGVEEALQRFEISPDQVSFTVHGTTIATNTIIEGKAARAGLITSKGFSDVLEIAYQTRPALYDINYEKPRPLVPRHRCIGVTERLDAQGQTLAPLDADETTQAAKTLVAAGAEAIAIAFLHSYRNPEPERQARELVRAAAPGIPVIISSDVCPQYGEYARTSTTVVNAVLQPKIGPYISRLEARLTERGVRSPLHLMTSSGGIIAAAAAKELPVHLVESGPAAGVIGAAFVASELSVPGAANKILALDIGGTTAKVALVDHATPLLAEQFEVGASARPTTTASRGQGYPVKTPVISLVEIGAGGGSIARIDPGGALTVGPDSAGAVPGPACYGQGGDKPTMTDANLVLGRLNPSYFVGGALSIDMERAREVIAREIAHPLQLSIEAAAQAIIDIANAKMIGALEFVSIQRGIDPREYALVPSGGNGALHAVAIAQALGISRVVVPPRPGVNSAVGLLATDVKHDQVRTLYLKIHTLSDDDLWGLLEEMASAGRQRLEQDGVAVARQQVKLEAEVCYVGQNYPLTVEIPPERAGSVQAIDLAFRAHHKQKYGFASATEPTLLMNLRATAIGKVDRPRIAAPTPSSDMPSALKGHRSVYFSGIPVRTAVYERDLLALDQIVDGPAVIEQMDTTTILPVGANAIVDRSGSLLITIDKPANVQ